MACATGVFVRAPRTPDFGDAVGVKRWLGSQRYLHLHCRQLGKGPREVSWVVMRNRTPLCRDESRCVILQLTS